MSPPSVLSSIQKLRFLLTREEKIKWLGIIGFALVTSFLEIITASIIVIFAQALNQPEFGIRYLRKIGMSSDLSAGRVISYLAVTVGIVYFLKNLIAAAEVFYQNFSIQKMNYLFKNKLLQRYATSDYSVYLTRNSAIGIQIITGDVDHIFSTGMIAMASIVSEGIVLLCLLGMIVFINPPLAFVIFGIGALLGIVFTKFVFPRFYRFGQNLQEASIGCNQNLIQFFHAFKEIVLLGKREAFINAYYCHSRKKSQIQALQTSINALPRMVIEVLFIGLFVTAIVFLCLEHDSPVQMVGTLGGYLYAGFRLMPALNRIISQLSLFKGCIPSIERIYTEYTSIAVNENYLDIPDFHYDDQISFTNVNFRYRNTAKDALSEITFDIQKGECIGIVGETGSGKSTLVDLILGLLKPYKGTILVDNKYPVFSYQWHERIGYVPQSIYLIDDTIEANIAFGEKDIDQSRLNEAITAAQLSKFVDQLPQGIKTIVGERGIRLSGGERQRIAIARAIYRNPEVLIFDEATSALDNETEEKLMKTIHQVCQNRTVIMIAHRLSTLKECNRIVVMEAGTIRDILSYEGLISQSKKREVIHA
jgi:ATP-binding cassette, subfamily B, bacterial PglK